MKIQTIMLLASLLTVSFTESPFITKKSKSITSAKEKIENMPAYYDGDLFTVNMMELSDDAAKKIIASNAQINNIYAYNEIDDPQDFIAVIDAVPADGFNPLWHQFLIVFNAGFTPHQFTSDEEVLEAAEGPNPEITLMDTGEIYRCSVIGSK